MKRVALAILWLLCWHGVSYAATCTWTGGTASWNNSNTASWSCGHVPTTSDTVVFDGTSGGGTVTVNSPNAANSVTVQSITCGAFTGTLDFSANNNNVTLSANAGVNLSGTGARTINLGNGIWTLSGAAGAWTATTTTNLTFNANSSTIKFTGTGGRSFSGGALPYNAVSVGAASVAALGTIAFSGAWTIATLTITAPNFVTFAAAVSGTVTNALSVNGTSSNQIMIASSSLGSLATLSSANNGTFMWCDFRDMTFVGGGTFTATNSFNSGNNSGITITAPSTTGGGGIIGG